MAHSRNQAVAFLQTEFSVPNQQIATQDANQIVETVKRMSGIHIDPTNIGFLMLRINRRLKQLNITDTQTYMERLNGLHGPSEAQHLVESLATHTTDFFREPRHFDFLRSTGLATLMDLGAGKAWPLVIWSAACSIGSELWTAGMVMDQFSLSIPGGLRWSLLGTDISRKVLSRATNAVFTEEELSGLGEDMRRAYLLRSKPGSRAGNGGTVYRIIPDMRRKAMFQWANIVDLSPEFSPRVDVAFLRNVLIYFKQAEKDTAVQNVTRLLRPGGYLFTGHAEAITNLPVSLTQIAPSVYRKAQNAD